MYETWPCPLPDGGTGEEMALRFDVGGTVRLLVLAPLFDEANKFRHQAFEIMRRLAHAGIDCFCPDLPGCNESLAAHGDQSLDGWRMAAAAAARHFWATHVFSIRSGAWLAPADLPGWLYAPAKPTQILRGMIRARTIGAREAGREETADDLLASGRRDGLVLAGWALSAKLVSELEREAGAPAGEQRVIEQAAVGGKPLWLRAENDHDPEQADALAAIIANESMGA